MTEGMRAFAAKYNVSLVDPDLKRMYDYEMSAKRDHASAIAQAENRGEQRGIQKGRAEGRAEGRDEERRTIIANMVRNGTPEEIIYKAVDAPRSEIDAIIAETKKE